MLRCSVTTKVICSVLLFHSQCHCLWSSLLFQWSDCGTIQKQHCGLRDCLPVSVRVSTRGKEDIAVWGRWKVGPWPSESVHRYNLFYNSYNFTFDLITYFCFMQTKASLQQLSQPSQLLSAHWRHSLLGLYVVYCSQSASAGGTRRDIALSQHQTHKNSSKQ